MSLPLKGRTQRSQTQLKRRLIAFGGETAASASRVSVCTSRGTLRYLIRFTTRITDNPDMTVRAALGRRLAIDSYSGTPGGCGRVATPARCRPPAPRLPGQAVRSFLWPRFSGLTPRLPYGCILVNSFLTSIMAIFLTPSAVFLYTVALI